MTASELFAGNNHNPGTHRCYYCGASCDEQYKTDDYVKDTFTNRDIVKFPQSKYVCRGCVESLGNGEDTMLMIDGTTKVRQNARGMCPRMYSWVLFPDHKLAGTKAHVKQWRELLINPPEPPFAVILADSGQKQLIFRAPVAMDRNNFSVMLEDEIIEITPEGLAERIKLATPVCAGLGKPALQGDISFSSYTRMVDYFGDAGYEYLEAWLKVKDEPLSRLAAWVSLTREEAQIEYPSIKCGDVPAEPCRTGGQKQAVTGNGTGNNQGRGGQILLDLG